MSTMGNLTDKIKQYKGVIARGVFNTILSGSLLFSSLGAADSLDISGQVHNKANEPVKEEVVVENNKGEGRTVTSNGNYTITIPKSTVPVVENDMDVDKNFKGELEIYNILGQKVNEVDYNGELSSKDIKNVWRGMNESGSNVASGKYIGLLKQDNEAVGNVKITKVDNNINWGKINILKDIQNYRGNNNSGGRLAKTSMNTTNDPEYTAWFNVKGDNIEDKVNIEKKVQDDDHDGKGEASNVITVDEYANWTNSIDDVVMTNSNSADISGNVDNDDSDEKYDIITEDDIKDNISINEDGILEYNTNKNDTALVKLVVQEGEHADTTNQFKVIRDVPILTLDLDEPFGNSTEGVVIYDGQGNPLDTTDAEGKAYIANTSISKLNIGDSSKVFPGEMPVKEGQKYQRNITTVMNDYPMWYLIKFAGGIAEMDSESETYVNHWHPDLVRSDSTIKNVKYVNVPDDKVEDLTSQLENVNENLRKAGSKHLYPLPNEDNMISAPADSKEDEFAIRDSLMNDPNTSISFIAAEYATYPSSGTNANWPSNTDHYTTKGTFKTGNGIPTRAFYEEAWTTITMMNGESQDELFDHTPYSSSGVTSLTKKIEYDQDSVFAEELMTKARDNMEKGTLLKQDKIIYKE